MADKLTIPQWRILENHRLRSEGKEPEYFPRNRSQSGAWTGAKAALWRKGFILNNEITAAGLQALQELAP